MHVMTRNCARKVLSEAAAKESTTADSPPSRNSKKSEEIAVADVEDCGGGGGAKNWEPRYWREHLDNIRQMRESKDAPVDSMGALACVADDLSPTETPPSTKRFQILLALMLSSQTRDETTFGAMKNLHTRGYATVEAIDLKIDEAALSELIYPVGFYRRKAAYIKATARILRETYGGDIPRSVEELRALPGVGPKMAHLAMQLAWDERTSGIGVDTHVHRICNRLGWCQQGGDRGGLTKTPEQTRKAVQAWLPKDLWSEVNLLMVGFGQQICTPIKPKCGECANREICLYARQHGGGDG